MRWRIETGMGVIAPLWHTIAFPASYIIYGNALAQTTIVQRLKGWKGLTY